MKNNAYKLFSQKLAGFGAAIALAAILGACEEPKGINVSLKPSLDLFPVNIDPVGITDYLKVENIQSMMPIDEDPLSENYKKPVFTVSDVNADVYNDVKLGEPAVDGTVVQTFALHYKHTYGIDLTEAATKVDLDEIFTPSIQLPGGMVTQPPNLENGIPIPIPAMAGPDTSYPNSDDCPVTGVAGMEYIIKIEFDEDAQRRKENSTSEVKLYYGDNATAAQFTDAQAADPQDVSVSGNFVTYKFKITKGGDGSDNYDPTPAYSATGGFVNTNSTKIFLKFPAYTRYDRPFIGFNWEKATIEPNKLDLDMSGKQELLIAVPDLSEFTTSLKNYGMQLSEDGAYVYMYVQMDDKLLGTATKLQLYVDTPHDSDPNIDLIGSSTLKESIEPARYIDSPFTVEALQKAAKTGFIEDAGKTTSTGKAVDHVMDLFIKPIDSGKNMTCNFYYSFTGETEVENPDLDKSEDAAPKGSSVGATIDLVILLPLKTTLDESNPDNTNQKIGDPEDPANTKEYTKMLLPELDEEFNNSPISMDDKVESLLNSFGVKKENIKKKETNFTVNELKNTLFHVRDSDNNPAEMYLVARDRDVDGNTVTTNPWQIITKVSNNEKENEKTFILPDGVKYLPEIAVFVDQGSNIQIGYGGVRNGVRGGIFRLRTSIGMDVSMDL